jgi:uncharacterized repeat protein (TIGR03803 family)
MNNHPEIPEEPIFKVTTSGVLTSLFSFNRTNGATPDCELLSDDHGSFYGTTYYGGTNGGYGTVFKVTASGAFTSLFSFSNTNGSYPSSGLAWGADGNLYGTTYQGGTNSGYGTVFRITTNGDFTSLLSFEKTNGAYPLAALIPGSHGRLYGTTYFGGDTNLNSGNGYGTLFSITTDGALTSLFRFNNTNGAGPRVAMTPGFDGNWYGTTYSGTNNFGTVFRLVLGASTGVVLNFKIHDGHYILTWSNPAYSLLSATNVAGSYSPVSGATSPYTNALSGTRRFFQLFGNSSD